MDGVNPLDPHPVKPTRRTFLKAGGAAAVVAAGGAAAVEPDG